MKLLISRFILIIALVAGLLGSTPSVMAAPSGFYLNPSSGTYQNGTVFAVQLRLNAGSNSGIQSNMDFDNTKLQVTGTSNQGSALSNVTTSYDNSAGRISAYSVSSSDSGDRLITTISFRAISPGTATVNFARSNQTLRYVLLVPVWTSVSTTNASYTIPTPPTPPPTSGGTTPSPNPSGGSTITPSNNGSSAKPNTNPTSPQTSASPTPSTTGNDTVAETPDAPAASRSDFPVPDFQTTKPDDEPWETSQAVPPSQLLVPWLPIIVTTISALVVGTIFAAYRRTHMSKALRRLLTSIVSYRIGKTQEKPASTFRFPLLGKIMPKLLAFTAPKLLAAGIKQKLLTAGDKWLSSKK